MDIELREYQKTCVDLVMNSYKKNQHGTELLVLPTGAGKTIIFCEIISQIAKLYGFNALVIAHRDELLDQAADKYRMVKPDAVIGKIGSGVHQYGAEVTVASIATISRPEHLKRLKAIGYGLVIVDEAHHVSADGYQRVLDVLPESFVLMVTATPTRLDKKEIIDKEPLYKATIVDMILDKYLCDVQVVGIPTETNLDGVHTEMGDYKVGELSDAVDTPGRNQCVVSGYTKHANGRKAICFAVTVAHAIHLAAAFSLQGIPADVVSGETPLNERKQMYHDFRAGKISVLCSVQVLTEGFDEPLVDCVIMARPTKSRSLYIQSVGRGLRIAPGKIDCIIIDLTDNSEKYGLQPQTLQKVLERDIKNGETLLEAVEREEKEERDTTRKIKNRRTEDVVINVVAQFTWQSRTNGYFVLEVGPEKHRIALIPSQDYDGYYRIAARLAPYFELQWWAGKEAMPLDYAQVVAEKKARMLLADAKSVKLIDRNAFWRTESATEAQLASLEKYKARYHLTYDPTTITKGQAADLLGPIFENFKKRAEQKQARKVSA